VIKFLFALFCSLPNFRLQNCAVTLTFKVKFLVKIKIKLKDNLTLMFKVGQHFFILVFVAKYAVCIIVYGLPRCRHCSYLIPELSVCRVVTPTRFVYIR
jgi:hypothetical protein